MSINDIVDTGLWADTVQTAVKAIREVEAPSHDIVLPGEVASPSLPYSSLKK